MRTRVAAGCLVLLLAGCGSPEAPLLDGLALNHLISQRPVAVAPGTFWAPREGTGGWTFRGRASIHCQILQEVEGPLTFLFTPTETTATFRFRWRWDGEDRTARLVSGVQDSLALTLSGDALKPGLHRLEVERLPPFDDGHDNAFSALRYRLGEEETPIEGADLERHRALADFLAYGVAGQSRQKTGGILVDGSAEAAFSIQADSPAFVSFRAQSFDPDPVTIELQGGGRSQTITVSPAGERALLLPAEAGANRFTVRVQGSSKSLVLLGAPTLEVSAPTEGTPIFLITLDTTRRDALSPYGAPEEATPRLQAFAQGATVYERAYGTAPWTLPSHASIMTGLYPSRHGAGVFQPDLRTEGTVAERLRQAGYLTAGFAGGDLASHRFGLSRGFARYRNPDTFETLGPRLNDAVEDFLRAHPRQRRLFVFANFFDPHAPYAAPMELREKFGVPQMRANFPADSRWQRLDIAGHGAWQPLFDGEVELTEQGLAYIRASYRAEIAFLDQQLGRLFDLLQELDLFDRSLILLVADHGELLGEHGGLFSHAGRLDPELTEIPLLVKWPQQTEGARVSTLVSQVDLFSTMLQVAGVAVPETDGHPLPRAGEDGPRRRLFMEEHESQIHPIPPRLRLGPHVYGIQLPDWRQVLWDANGEALGECAQRREERWRGSVCEEPAAHVLQRIQLLLGQPQDTGPVGQMSPEVEAQLKALGYL